MNEPIYLTKLSLDAAFCYKNRITDAYSLHRVVYSMLPRTDEPKRILYVDQGSVNGIREVLILSGIMPDIPQNVTAFHYLSLYQYLTLPVLIILYIYTLMYMNLYHMYLIRVQI